MTCCVATILNFLGVATMTINYSADMIANYGPEPNVQIYYLDGAEYVLSDDMNQVKFDGVNINIDFGGPGEGFVKIF